MNACYLYVSCGTFCARIRRPRYAIYGDNSRKTRQASFMLSGWRLLRCVAQNCSTCLFWISDHLIDRLFSQRRSALIESFDGDCHVWENEVKVGWSHGGHSWCFLAASYSTTTAHVVVNWCFDMQPASVGPALAVQSLVLADTALTVSLSVRPTVAVVCCFNMSDFAAVEQSPS